MECSVVRIGDHWRDQVRQTGFHDSPDAALDAIAALGILVMRTPLLWERLDPSQPGAAGWGWHDRLIDGLHARGIIPVAGLLHHGAGPANTSLLDPGLPAGLAAHARAVALRYPTIDIWTPVNEPLTTARFACLYGHWHPHHADEASFLRAVVLQCAAALAAMEAIRLVQPQARFMHTEDLGRVFATPPNALQADYENGRRWLSLDLLAGKVDRSHPWHAGLIRAGADPRHLDALATGAARPDLLGINHYVTSDRFLDHRLALYPPGLHGTNGRDHYVDTEAMRVDLPPLDGAPATGWAARLREAWARYQVPIVLSEVHLGCREEEEQLRWLMEGWNAAQAVRAEGADIRAVTAWALFGLMDWDSLLREERGSFEPGAIDLRDPAAPGGSLLARAIQALATTGTFDHPCLRHPGWWQREDRVHRRA